MKYKKFRDIPQFTSIGSYQANMAVRAIPEQIHRWEIEHRLQLNPDFQRGHVWTEKQQIAYMEYLLHGGKGSRVIYFNHPGWMRHFEGDFVCVDGLQRITACLKLMNNKIKVFGQYYKDFEDEIHYDVDLLFNVNNLKTREEVLQWYIEMNTGGTIHSDEQISKVKRLLKKEK